MEQKESSKINLLITAYACSPSQGSEAGVAWWWITNCAKSYDVTVITCEAQRLDIEKAVASENINIKFKFIKWPKSISPSGVEHRFERFKVYFWEILAIYYVRQLTNSIKFDLSQHISIATWRLPSCLAFTNVPFILGPVSGSEILPKGFSRHLSFRGFIWSNVRNFLIHLSWYDPFIRYTLLRAKRILVSSPQTYEQLKKSYNGKVEYYGHAFKSLDILKIKPNMEKEFYVKNVIKLVWMGNLIPRKGLELVIRALKDKRLHSCILDIMGEGPEKKRCLRIAKELGVENRINFLGRLPRKEAINKLIEYDVFVFSSLQDMMGQALSEAMQMGLPCVVMNWGGPSALVGDTGAVKVPISSFKDTCQNLADKLVEVCFNPKRLKELSYNAIQRINYLSDQELLNKKRDKIFASILHEHNLQE